MKKLTAVLALSISSAAISSAALASEATLRIGEDAVSVFLAPQATETHSVGLGLAHNADDDISVLSGGLFANGQREQFTGRLGGKLYYADLDGDSGYGIALGGDLKFTLSQDLSIIGGLYYGPSSISFSDVDGYEEWFVKAHFQLFENGALGAGYGSFELEPEEGRDIEVDDGLFVEMTLSF